MIRRSINTFGRCRGLAVCRFDDRDRDRVR
jgi:hypothetical protein